MKKANENIKKRKQVKTELDFMHKYERQLGKDKVLEQYYTFCNVA